MLQEISEIVPEEIKIILYFEACGGQNKNIKMSLVLFKLVYSTNITTESNDHKLKASVHSFFPNDAEFLWSKQHVTENSTSMFLEAERIYYEFYGEMS